MRRVPSTLLALGAALLLPVGASFAADRDGWRSDAIVIAYGDDSDSDSDDRDSDSDRRSGRGWRGDDRDSDSDSDSDRRGWRGWRGR